MDFEIEDGVLIRYTGNDTDVIIPDGVTHIGAGAFEDCENLASITIPDSVTSIGDRAFYNCENLRSVTLPDDMEMDRNVFANCPNLEI